MVTAPRGRSASLIALADLGSTRVLFFASVSSTGWTVVEVVIGENDRLDVALKQFQRKVIRAGVLKDIRKKRFYEKPSEARQRKAGAARQRVARARRRGL